VPNLLPALRMSRSITVGAILFRIFIELVLAHTFQARSVWAPAAKKQN